MVTQHKVTSVPTVNWRKNFSQPIDTDLLVNDVARQRHQIGLPLIRAQDRISGKVWMDITGQMDI